VGSLGPGPPVPIKSGYEADSIIRSNVIRGPRISNLGHVTSATPKYGSLYDLYAGRVRPPSQYLN